MGAIALSLSGNAISQEEGNGIGMLAQKQEGSAKVVSEVAAQKGSLSLSEDNAESEPNETKEAGIEQQRQKEMSQVSRLDALTTKASEGNLELQILQQDLERKKLENQIKEDEFKQRLDSAMNSLSLQFQEKEAEYQSTIESLQNELRRQRHMSTQIQENAQKMIAESKKTENSVFVTNVVGVGSNLTASIYYEDKIIDVREGMRLSPELSVLEIMANGVIFKDGSEESFVALTNEEYAFSKTFNKDAARLMESTMSGQARRN